MVTRVDEVMNRELFTVRPGEAADEVRGYLMAVGLTGAPVIDLEGRPIGQVSLGDLVETRPGDTAQRRMSRPPLAVPAGASLEEAARKLVEAGVHRLIVVDAGGHAVGVVGSVDVVRGLLGLPAVHPAPIRGFDVGRDLEWTDDRPLDRDRVEIAPLGAGLFVLTSELPLTEDPIFWAEASRDVRFRLLEVLSAPQSHLPHLARGMARGHVRFRVAALADLERGRRIACHFLEASVRTAPIRVTPVQAVA